MATTSPEPLRVAVCGIFGRVGTTVANAVAREDDLTLAGGVDIIAADDGFPTATGQTVATDTDMPAMLARAEPDVIVDFTRADAARVNVRSALEHGVNAVVGTTGMEISEIEELGEVAAANDVGLVVAPNFALSAVLMMHVSKLIGKHMDYCDIVEYHHERKIDAPSGTALQSALDIREARGSDFISVPTEKETLVGTRGGVHGGINVHAVRLPGDGGPSADSIWRFGADPYHPPGLHQHRVICARRAHGGARGTWAQGPHPRAGRATRSDVEVSLITILGSTGCTPVLLLH